MEHHFELRAGSKDEQLDPFEWGFAFWSPSIGTGHVLSGGDSGVKARLTWEFRHVQLERKSAIFCRLLPRAHRGCPGHGTGAAGARAGPRGLCQAFGFRGERVQCRDVWRCPGVSAVGRGGKGWTH